MPDIGMPDDFGARVHDFTGITKYALDYKTLANMTSDTLEIIDNRHGQIINLKLHGAITTNGGTVTVHLYLDDSNVLSLSIERFSKNELVITSSGLWTLEYKPFDENAFGISFNHIIDFNKSVALTILNQSGASASFYGYLIYKDFSI